MTRTYDSILKNASRLFLRQGYTATSLRQIAEETGISKAAIYHYFPDKESIIKTLTGDIPGGMKELLARIKSQKDPVVRIETAANESIRYLFRTFDMFQIIRRELPDSTEKMKKNLRGFFREYLFLIADAISKGRERNIFRDIDPIAGARTFLAMIQGTFASAFIAGENPGPFEKKISAILDVFFNGIKKEE